MPFILNRRENPPFELGNLSLLGGQAWIKESAEGAIPVSPLHPASTTYAACSSPSFE
jgi:hypothetical protein